MHHLDYPVELRSWIFGETELQGIFHVGTTLDENAADNVQAYFRYLEKHKVTYLQSSSTSKAVEVAYSADGGI